MRHKYKIGQLVDFSPSGGRSSLTVEIVTQLPPEAGGQLQYRVKSKAENFERMAKENELSPR